jgi:hypothetical protein
MIEFHKLQWLFPVVVALHNSEEAIWMPRWTSQHHIRLPFDPPQAGQIRFALIVLTVAAFVVTYLSQRSGKQSFWAYLVFGCIIAVLVNVFLPHVPATFEYRTYTPGVVTAVFVNLPSMSYLAFISLRENWVAGKRALVSGITIPLAIAGTIPILLLMGRLLTEQLG